MGRNTTEHRMQKGGKSSSRPTTFCPDITDPALAGSFQGYILPRSIGAVEQAGKKGRGRKLQATISSSLPPLKAMGQQRGTSSRLLICSSSAVTGPWQRRRKGVAFSRSQASLICTLIYKCSVQQEKSIQ